MNPSTVIDITRAERPWRREWLGGLNATAVMLPFVLTYGYLVFGSAGTQAVQAGLAASVLATVLGPFILMALSRAAMPAGSPSATTALILGALVLQLASDPAMQPGAAGGAAYLLAGTAAAVVGAGVLLVALGALRAGRLVRLVPQPVLAGFMNGVALLIMASQIPALFGISAAAWLREGVGALAHWQGATLAAAACTALVVVVARRWRPRWPGSLLALVLGTLVVVLLEGAGVAHGNGPLVRVDAGHLSWPHPDVLAPWFSGPAAEVLWRHAGTVAVTALLLALIGGLESVLNLAGADQLTEARTPPDRELVALGVANIVLGLFGGLFLMYLRLRALAAFNGGGRRRQAVLVSSVLLALVFTFGLPLVRQVPVAVVAGIVLMLGWSLVDQWTRQLVAQWWRGERSPDLRLSLAVVALVCAVTLVWGFVVGVAVGITVSMAIFIRALNRSLLRARFTAATLASRRIYPPAVEAQLATLRPQIEIFELEGALFFGNVERLQVEAELPAPGRVYLVLDLRRVSTIDVSGAMGLAQLRERALRTGTAVLLAGVTPGNRHGLTLRSHGAALGVTYADADRAIEAAELALLQQAGYGVAGRHLEPAQNVLLKGLTEAQAGRVQSLLQRRELAAGELLFEEGDAGDTLYLLARGSISTVNAANGQRFVSFSPGMCFGETAVLDSGGRTADAVADVPSTVHALSKAALRQLEAEEPAIAALLYRNLATHLSQRLRAAAGAWREAAG
jgi:MFS superfamily sulfate permease-like transporter